MAWFGLAVGLALWSGCTLLKPPGGPRKAQAKTLHLATNAVSGPVTMRSLQIEVMRFADNYAAVVAHAADDFNFLARDSDTRRIAAKWKLEQATAAYIDASGPNPIINALDMVVLATASRMVMEDGLLGTNDALVALMETHRTLESNAWGLVTSVLRPDQQQELRELIVEWRRKNPRQRNVTALRFREFVSALDKAPARTTTAPTSLFSLLFLDPMASMDPTTAAIEDARNTAERAMYYTQRLPTLLNWQMELLAYELAVQPETKQLLADSGKFAESSATFARTAEQLPRLIDEQRQAAIKQVLEGLVPQEKQAREILAAAREVAVETRETLKTGSAAADSINTAIKTLDTFVRSVSSTNEGTTATNRRPYDILDYATAAREIGLAAKDLNGLLTSANESAARLAQIRQQTAAEAIGVVDHTYRRALTLIVILLAGGLLAGILYRRITSRWNPRHPSSVSADCQK